MTSFWLAVDNLKSLNVAIVSMTLTRINISKTKGLVVLNYVSEFNKQFNFISFNLKGLEATFECWVYSLLFTKQRVLFRTCMNNFVNKKEMMSTIKFALFNLTNWFHQIQHIKWEPLKFNLFWSKIKHGVLNLNFLFF